MSRVDIFFTVSGQRISQDIDNPELHAGDKRHFYAVFDLEEAFSEADPKAVFTKQGGSVLMDLVKREDGKFECVIPWEAMYTSGFFTVGIFGGDMMLTNALSVKVFQGCTPEGGAPLEPTPGWFDSIEAQVRGIEKGLENKVDKVTGKGLSTNDYTDAEKKKVKDTADALGKKVDKVEGKGLSTNDYTNEEKKKVQGATDELKNKVDRVDGKGLSTNDYTDSDKQKLEGIEEGAEVNTVTSVAGKDGDVTLFKEDVGLGSVDNTSDEDKPLSKAAREKFEATEKNISDVRGEIPKSVSQLANDSNFISSAETDNKISEHNTKEDSHNDIRLLIKDLTDRLNAFLDTDDTTLDQLSEIVEYITSNKDLIDNITTSKVNVSDIIDNLTTSVPDKPLSAKQGVVLKALIDALNTAVSDINSHMPYISEDGWWYVWSTDDKVYIKTEIKAKGESITHSWEGTTLIITSASGTSSADLKGEQGESGVYIGSGEMPENCNVQIDPDGDAFDVEGYIEEVILGGAW